MTNCSVAAWPSGLGIHFSRWCKLRYRFKSQGGKIYIFFFWLVFHRIFTLWLVSLYSQCLPIIASRDVCDYSVFLVRGSAEEVGFTVNRIPLNCYSSGPKDFHLFAPTFELVPRLETSRDSFSFSLVFRKSPENETAFAHSCLPPRYIQERYVKRIILLGVNSVQESLVSVFTKTQNAPVELWSRHQTNFTREHQP